MIIERAKEDIRKEILGKRLNLSRDEVNWLSELIIKNLLSLEELSRAKTLMIYSPIKGEPDITGVMGRVGNRRFLFPRVNGKEIEPIEVRSLQDLEKGSFGVMEPKKGTRVEPESIDAVLVPGIAFDRHGYRLGWGKGYYDRLLKRVGGIKVGIAYSFQVFDRLPRDPWDVPVDAVVTEKEVIRRL